MRQKILTTLKEKKLGMRVTAHEAVQIESQYQTYWIIPNYSAGRKRRYTTLAGQVVIGNELTLAYSRKVVAEDIVKNSKKRWERSLRRPLGIRYTRMVMESEGLGNYIKVTPDGYFVYRVKDGNPPSVATVKVKIDRRYESTVVNQLHAIRQQDLVKY